MGTPNSHDDGDCLRDSRTRPCSSRKRMYIAPCWQAWQPSESKGAPTTRSGRPSPLRSPGTASAEPNAEAGVIAVVMPADVPLIFCTSRTEPPGRRKSTYTAPASGPLSSSPGAPTAISLMPSPSKSPMRARDAPKLSLSRRSMFVSAPSRPMV
eukprot:scaffold193563_cov29-Tisochrysis_lutea.AAC.3